MADRTIQVDLMTRVEGEGRFTLRLSGDRVERAELSIFEAPRFFEALLRGRSAHDVSDIVARICGICPVAYQVSAANALESALGVRVPESIRRLRRLFYCGEWVASHALHVFMLSAPDFLGLRGALDMASGHRELLERGLRLKAAGNRIMELVGGRATHPVAPRLGGFFRAPTRTEVRGLEPELSAALEDATQAVRWASTLSFPPLELDAVHVALDADEYPLEQGEALLVSGRGRVPLDEWESHFAEQQVPHSNALHCRLTDGTPFLCGPAARFAFHQEKLHPLARELAREVGLENPVRNPHRWILVRCVEIVHGLAEALALVDEYVRPEPAFVEVAPRRANGVGASEAPRGLLWHRYELDDDGLVERARIVPPTSQNQARIELDLAEMAGRLVALDQAEATALCERVIRAYDPCISCATHFLQLDVGRD